MRQTKVFPFLPGCREAQLAINLFVIQESLERLSDPDQACILMRFFKTGPGEYGEGDQFRGIKVPQIRKLVGTFSGAPLTAITELLHSPFHEDRLLALLLLVKKYQEGNDRERAVVYRLYLANSGRINNWDLVDFTAEHIVGAHLYRRSRRPLARLAASPLLWDRRIALLATFYFIRHDDFSETLRLVSGILDDKEDLMHKAMGWMLREIGKRDLAVEERFLRDHLAAFPRTTLRYAIERFPEKKRLAYLHGAV
ncbi:MAG: DNA alkylation repair protein [Chitinispirillaceae bacterium]|nr:DNA alkylation repair protein [Chitinispirillaceae bacterium]